MNSTWDGFRHSERLAARSQAGTPLPDVRVPVGGPERSPLVGRVPVLRRQNAVVGSGQGRNLRGSRFCFTYQSQTNETDQLMIVACASGMANGDMIYVIWGIEAAPTTGRRHLQGYMETPETVRFTAALNLLPAGCHLEIAKGDAASNVTYCKKEGDWRDYGAPKPGRGHRSDMEDIREALDGGADMREISQEYFGQFIRYHRGFQQYINLHRKQSVRTKLDLRWYWGPTGSGKTSILQTLVAGEEAFWLEPGPTGTWWNGYDGQEIVVFDELRSGWFPHSTLLKILQPAPYSCPCHGAKVQLTCSKIYITSNLPPNETYREDPAGALMRRVLDFGSVYHVGMGCVITRLSGPRVTF